MGLEVASYISGLNTAWPLAGDTKSQGDDHLRLIKGVLTATFPNATKPFYIPSAEAFAGSVTLDATDQNNIIMVDCTAGDITCALPTTLTSADKGWSCQVLRTNVTGTNGIVVSSAAGNISSAVGSVATIRIERPFEPATFVWTGTAWFVYKVGEPIGSSMNWDGSTVPPSYRLADGTAYSAVTFAELNAALGTTTLRDKRGRVEAGVDGGVGRITATYLGATPVLGAVGGIQSNSTVLRHQHGGSTSNASADHNHSYERANLASSQTGGGSFSAMTSNSTTITTGMSATHAHTYLADWPAGSEAAHTIMQPTLITNKLIRVC